MTQPANHDPITRARLLAADYQANPTPARAHNAAQVLGAVLDQLDGAHKLNTDMWALIAKLALKGNGEHNAAVTDLAAQLDMPPLTELPTDAANHWTALDRAHAGQLCDFATEHLGFTDADKPTTEQLADLVAKHMRPITQPLCHAPTSGLNCIYPLNHEGDHSVIAVPPGFPIVVPADQLPPATGGIVDTTTTARIGEN